MDYVLSVRNIRYFWRIGTRGRRGPRRRIPQSPISARGLFGFTPYLPACGEGPGVELLAPNVGPRRLIEVYQSARKSSVDIRPASPNTVRRSPSSRTPKLGQAALESATSATPRDPAGWSTARRRIQRSPRRLPAVGFRSVTPWHLRPDGFERSRPGLESVRISCPGSMDRWRKGSTFSLGDRRRILHNHRSRHQGFG